MTARLARRTGVLAGALAVGLGACGAPGAALPSCEPGTRLGIIAQSVGSAAYVPCITELPEGWAVAEVDIGDDGTEIVLDSDRADREVVVSLVASCDVSGATPIEASDEGVRTYSEVEAIDPRFAGRFVDVFPGGCVVARYDFERGPHVALVTELRAAVDLLSRRELREALEDDVGITLDP